MRKRLWALTGVFLSLAVAAFAPVASSADPSASVERGIARCGKCGDGYCNPSCGENQFTCPRDCAVTGQ